MTNHERQLPADAFQAYLVPMQRARAPQATTLDAVLAAVWAQWKVIALWAAVGFVLAVGIGFLITPVYRSTVVVLPRSPDDSKGVNANGLLSKLGMLGGGLSGLLSTIGSNETESVAILESRDLAESFISEQHIAARIEAQRNWLEKLLAGPAEPAGGAVAPAVFRYFAQHVIDFNEDHQTGLVTITVDWPEKPVARDWANAFVVHANEVIRKQAIDRAEATLRYVAVQMQQATEVEVRNSLGELAEDKMKTLSLAKTEPDFAFKVIDSANLPDNRDKVRPHKAIMGLVGMLLAGLIAVAVVYRRRAR